MAAVGATSSFEQALVLFKGPPVLSSKRINLLGSALTVCTDLVYELGRVSLNGVELSFGEEALTCLAENTVTPFNNLFLSVTAVSNVALRVWSLSQALSERHYQKAFLNASALAALYLPYGIWASAMIDLYALWIDTQRISTTVLAPFVPPPSPLNPHDFKEACQILGIECLGAKDRHLVERKYQQDLAILEEKRRKARGDFIIWMDRILSDFKIAYQTILQEIDRT